jgi:superfamily II DNA or RNA helicase
MPRPQLRSYQIADLDRVLDALDAARRGRVVYQAPTGSGKTVLFADLISQEVAANGRRALVLAHRIEIVEQVSAALEALEVNHGIIAPDYPHTDELVQVGSVMSVVRRLKRMRPPFLIVIDEAHHSAAGTWQKIIAAFPDSYILGVTATPRRLDGKPLDDTYDDLVVGPSIAKLIDLGYLAPCTVFTPPTNPDLSKVHIRAGDYAIEQLSAVMSRGMIVRGAVEEYQRLCDGDPAIAFCVDIKHSKLVANAFRAAGYRAEHVDGDTSPQLRRELIADLGRGRIDVLSNCQLISEGLDVPGVAAAILLRPTQSLTLYLQMVGRALRPADGKDEAVVLDHAGNVYRHGLPTANRRWSLHGKQLQTAPGNKLVRCPNCGAINSRGLDECEHCGAELVHHRAPRVEVAGRMLVEAVEVPVTDWDIAKMGKRGALRWAAPDGRLRADRLERIAEVRGYKRGWVYYNAGKHWEEVWKEMEKWRRENIR